MSEYCKSCEEFLAALYTFYSVYIFFICCIVCMYYLCMVICLHFFYHQCGTVLQFHCTIVQSMTVQ